MEGDLSQPWSRSLASCSCRLHCTWCAVQLQCAARMSFHRTRTVMSRGGDRSAAGNGGRARTGGDIYIPKSSRAGQVGSSSSMFSVFGTSHRSKANWQVFYSKRSRPFPQLLILESGRLTPLFVATGFSDVNGLH